MPVCCNNKAITAAAAIFSIEAKVLVSVIYKHMSISYQRILMPAQVLCLSQVVSMSVSSCNMSVGCLSTATCLSNQAERSV